MPESDRKREATRGQVEPQHLIGAIIVVVVVGPLATVSREIYSSLANTPAISDVIAGVLTLSIIGAIILQILVRGGQR